MARARPSCATLASRLQSTLEEASIGGDDADRGVAAGVGSGATVAEEGGLYVEEARAVFVSCAGDQTAAPRIAHVAAAIHRDHGGNDRAIVELEPGGADSALHTTPAEHLADRGAGTRPEAALGGRVRGGGGARRGTVGRVGMAVAPDAEVVENGRRNDRDHIAAHGESDALVAQRFA